MNLSNPWPVRPRGASGSGRVSHVAALLLDALFPRKCLYCGRFFQLNHNAHPRALKQIAPETPVFNSPAVDNAFDEKRYLNAVADIAEHRLMQVHRCPSCRTGIQPIASPICTVCGNMFRSRSGHDHLCGDCIRRPKPYRRARAAAVYAPGLVELVHCLKYGGRTKLAVPLGELLLCAFGRYWPCAGIDLIQPVPLHLTRLRQRGFNQAHLLIQAWKKVPKLDIVTDLLVRVRRTVSQTGLGRAERRRNIRRAFRVKKPHRVRGKRILLIDDILTTGATVEECARELLRSGAGQVDVLTLARVV